MPASSNPKKAKAPIIRSGGEAALRRIPAWTGRPRAASTRLALLCGAAVLVGAPALAQADPGAPATSASLPESGTVENGLNTLAVGADNSDSSFSGTVVNQGNAWDDTSGTFEKLGTGVLTLNGATITGGQAFIGGGGTIAQASGNSAIGYLAVGEGGLGNGTLQVAGGSITFGTGLQVGDFGGSGVVNQTGGQVRVEANCGDSSHCASLNIGNQGGAGVYNISGGELAFSSGVFDLGRNATGKAASSGTLNIGGTGAVGVANIGSLVIGDWLQLNAGDTAGTGVINQTGGMLSVDATSKLYLSGSGNGTYNLDGGTLQIGGASLIGNYGSHPSGTPAGTYAFNLGGGTIQVIGSALAASVNATLMPGTTSTIDTNGLGATWSGVLSGGGGLNKAGDGTLILTGANGYTGGTTITGGALALTGSGSIGAGAPSLVDNGTFDISAASGPVTLGSLSGSGTVNNGLNALVVGADNSSSSFSGTINNSGNAWDADTPGTFVKLGTGVLTLNGATITGGQAFIGGGGAIAQASGSSAISYLAVGESVFGNGVLQVTGGSLTLGVGLQVGDFGASGVVNQTGGQVQVDQGCGDSSHCASLNIGSQGGAGVYNISGGQLAFSGGFFDLGRNSSGDPASSGALNISGTGSVSVAGGSSMIIGDWLQLNANDIAGTGVITQTGGLLSIDATSKLYLSGSGNGTYNLDGGTLQIGGGSLIGNYGSHPSGTPAGSYAFNLGGGTIQVIGSALAASVDATLTPGTTSTIDTNGLGGTWSGVLSGDGGLNKAGDGTLILTGANGYTGGTTVSGGTLQIGAGGTIGSIQGDVTDNATLAFDHSDATTFAGVVSGAGGISQIGAGTLTLTGANSYTGQTAIAAGSELDLTGAGGVAGSSVAVDGVFDIHAVDSDASIASLSGAGTVNLGMRNLSLTQAAGTFAGAVAGAGGLTVAGGTETLTGANSYGGGTRIASGATLQIGNGGTSGAITGNVATDGTLAFNRSDDVTFGGTISGGGSVGKAGAGTLTLTGDNSYSGGTAVTGGTLYLATDTAAGSGAITLGDGTVLSLADGLDVTNPLVIAGAVRLNVDSGSATESGALSGSGSYVVTGAGTLHLTGDNSQFTGKTVLTGTTVVDVDNGGVFGGSTVQVTDQVTLHYGASVQVSNAADVASGAVLTAQVDSGGSATQAGAVSGGGALSKTGSGTLVLAGNNSYTGGTTISSGVLQVGAGGTSGAITGDVVNNAALVFNRSDTAAYGGAISGAGTVAQSGSGTLVLTGTNTYTGGTTISSGVLQVGAGGTSGAITGNVADNGTLAFNRADSVTFAGTVSGAGGVAQGGPGTLVLSGANSYTGGTTISSGVLQVGAGGTSGSITGNVADNGALAFDRSDDVAFGGAISGTGVLQKDGGGDLTLTGDNSYSGGTALNAGGLILGGAGVLGTGALAMADGASLGFGGSFTLANAISVSGDPTFQVDAGDTVTVSGAISDGATPGDIVKTGDGTLVLTADNTYTGGTTVSAGVLQVGAGGTSGAIAGGVVDNATLAFDRSDDVTFAGAIAGTGLLRQVGTGMLTLSGDSSAFAGATEVAAGVLAVNGALGGSLTVDRGATLAGTGRVGAASVAAGATLSPGGAGSIGTLTVNGGLALAAGSTYAVDIDQQGHSDLVHVTGAASLGGAAVNVQAHGGWNIQAPYTILTADGGVSGTLALSGGPDFAFLTPGLTYDAHDAYLTFVRNGVPFASVATTRNQAAVGGALDRLGTGDLYNAVVQLDVADARSAFGQLAGDIHPSINAALLDDSRFVRDAGVDRVRSAFGGVGASDAPVTTYGAGGARAEAATTDQVAWWSQGFGAWGQHDGEGAATLSRSTGGFLAGGDAPVLGRGRIGVLTGYSHTSFDGRGTSGSAQSDNYDLGAYGGAQWGRLGLRAGLAYTWSDVTLGRSVAFTGFQNRLSSDYSAYTAQAFGELGYRLQAGLTPIGRLALEPYADLAYVNVHADGFEETGGPAALFGHSGDTGAAFSTLGLRGETRFALAGMELTASGGAGWRRAYGEVTPTTAMRFAEGDGFTVAGTPIARDAVLVQAGLSTTVARNLSINVSYTGQFSDHAQDEGLNGGFSWRF